MASLKNILKLNEKLLEKMQNDPRKDTFNVLLYGRAGTGKTYSLKTARKPILIFSFDPKGTDVLREEKEAGSILVDTSFESEDFKKPFAWRTFKYELDKYKDAGFFDHIGTVVLDSLTTVSACVISYVLSEAKRSLNGPLRIQDWGSVNKEITQVINTMVRLPCDTVVTAHVDTIEDPIESGEKTKILERTIAVIKGLKSTLPVLFSEIYYCKLMGNSYMWQIHGTSDTLARTRLGKKGVLKGNEKQDFREILRKVGLSYKDKPSFKQLEKESNNE